MPEDLIEQKCGGAVRVQLVVCIWVRVRRFFLVGAAGFFNVMMQKISFVFAAAWLHKVDLVMGKKKFTKDSLFNFHPAPRFVKEC